jgi:hypothetical protein
MIQACSKVQNTHLFLFVEVEGPGSSPVESPSTNVIYKCRYYLVVNTPSELYVSKYKILTFVDIED